MNATTNRPGFGFRTFEKKPVVKTRPSG